MKHFCVTGDSISHGVNYTTYENRSVADLIAFQKRGWLGTNIAWPADGDVLQLYRWGELDPSLKLKFDYVVSMNGNNMINYVTPTATSIAAYQNLINVIRSEVKPSCKIIVCTLTPAQDVYATPPTAAAVLANRQAFNEAVKGNGPTPLTGWDFVVTQHTSYMDDGAYSLKSIYYEWGSDHLHPNKAGRDVIADVIALFIK